MSDISNNQKGFIVNDRGYDIEAVYAINEYISSCITNAGYITRNFYPGKFAPSTENQNKFVTYYVTPGQVYDLFGLKNDIVDYVFYSDNFEELQRVINVVMRKVNVEDIQDTTLTEAGIIFQDAVFAPTGRGEAHFADGVEHYFINAELKLMYTENR